MADLNKELQELTKEKAEAIAEVEQRILDLQREQGRLSQTDLELLKENSELTKQKAIIEAEITNQKKLQHDYVMAKNNDEKLALEQQIKASMELLDLATRKLAQLEEENKLRKAAYNHADNLFKRTLGFMYSDVPETALGAFINDPGNFAKRMAENFGKLGDIGKVITGLVDSMATATKSFLVQQDAAIASFRQATSSTGEFDNVVIGLEESLFGAGVTSAEAAKSVGSLFNNVSDFTMMSKAEQETLGKTVAVLNELGVSTEITSKNIQFATKVMGLNAIAAEKQQRELFKFAQDLGVSATKIASDFGTMAPQIAALGNDGVAAFRELEVQSKATGLQLSEILSITAKFDTFDSAAQSVGKLNALMGGPFLNTLEMVSEVDPSERFRILKDRLDEAGLSFDQMDYYQKKAYASALGLNEQQLALLMRGRIELIQEPAKSAEDIEKLAEQTAQFNTIMDELAQLGRLLVVDVFQPLVPLIKSLANQLQKPWVKNVLLVVVAIGALVKVTLALIKLAPALKAIIDMFSLFGSAAAPTIAPAISAIGAASTTAAPGVASLGAALLEVGIAALMVGGAILMVGAAIGIAFLGMAAAVYGISALIESIAKLEMDKVLMYQMVIGTTVMAAPLLALASPALAVLAATGIFSSPETQTANNVGTVLPPININIYFGEDTFNDMVNKVTLNGTTTTIAELAKIPALTQSA